MLNKDFVRIEISFIQNELAKFGQFGSYSINEAIDNVLVTSAIQKFLGRLIEQSVRVNQYLIIELEKTKSPPLDYADTFRGLIKYKVIEPDFFNRIKRSLETNNAILSGFVDMESKNIYSHIYECIDDYYKYCEKILKFIDKYPM